MSFASDISAVTKTSSDDAVSGRTRIQGVYYTCSAVASSFSLKDGSTSAGTALLTVNTPAAAGAVDLIFPDDGILFKEGVYIDLTNSEVKSVTLLFVGGAAV
jgi:hypothetical protein